MRSVVQVELQTHPSNAVTSALCLSCRSGRRLCLDGHCSTADVVDAWGRTRWHGRAVDGEQAPLRLAMHLHMLRVINTAIAEHSAAVAAG